MRYFLFALIFAGCSEWYLVKDVTLHSDEINQVIPLLDTSRSGLENIRTIQKATEYQWRDFWWASGYAVAEGTGLGFYESKNFYGKNAFPGADNWFLDWYRMDTSGDAWMKIGAPDKVFRSIWQVSNKLAWNKYLKFYGGNWVFAYLTEFTISNSVAGLIRKYAKRGEFYISLEFDFRFLEAILK